MDTKINERMLQFGYKYEEIHVEIKMDSSLVV